MKDLNYLCVNTSQDLPDIVWRRWHSGSPLWTVRQSTSARSTSVWYSYWRRCQALTVEVTQVAEAERMLRPWHCHVSSAEHLCTPRLRFSKQQSVWAWFLGVLKAGWVGLSNMQPSLSSEHSWGGGSHDTSGAFLSEKKENKVVVRALALSGHRQPEGPHTTHPISHPCDASKLGQCPALLLLNEDHDSHKYRFLRVREEKSTQLFSVKMALTASRMAYSFCTHESLDKVCCGQKKSDPEPIIHGHTQKLCFPHSLGLIFLWRGQRSGAESVKPVPDPRLLFSPAQCTFLGQFEPSHVEKVIGGVQTSP